MKPLQQYLLAFIVIVLIFSVTILRKTEVVQNLQQQIASNCQSYVGKTESEEVYIKEYDAALLDDCYHIYLDVGTNVGIQIRKLYEPQLYPDAGVHQIFNTYFHKSSLPWVCTVGFEPNPHHSKDLLDLQTAYNKCGHKVHIFRESAAGNYDGDTVFFSDNEPANLEWGGTIIDPSGHEYGHIKGTPSLSAKVRIIQLSRFINEVVGKRKLPNNDQLASFGPPKVLMKMDIEGSEVEVLPDLICSGSLNQIDGIMVEFHEAIASDPNRKAATAELRTLVDSAVKFNNLLRKDSRKTEIIALDDETYYLSKFSLPECK